MDEKAERPLRPQVVLFNFDGAAGIEFGGRPAVDIPAFDAGGISDALAGTTDELIDLVLEMVREDYEGIDVSFMTSRSVVASGEEVTVLHFGAYDRALLGVAENIDEFNERRVQEAIVFTDTFSVFNVLRPTVEQYAQALANVASHEAGHLLGLSHTSDRHGVMDITATLRQLTRNQAFSRSPLERMTFPTGHQDAVQSLIESVGGDMEVSRLASAAQLGSAKVVFVEVPELFDLPRSTFSVCLCDRCEAKKLKRERMTH
jgi:predicted Zn-dependent protease